MQKKKSYHYIKCVESLEPILLRILIDTDSLFQRILSFLYVLTSLVKLGNGDDLFQKHWYSFYMYELHEEGNMKGLKKSTSTGSKLWKSNFILEITLTLSLNPYPRTDSMFWIEKRRKFHYVGLKRRNKSFSISCLQWALHQNDPTFLPERSREVKGMSPDLKHADEIDGKISFLDNQYKTIISKFKKKNLSLPLAGAYPGSLSNFQVHFRCKAQSDCPTESQSHNQTLRHSEERR